MFFGREFLSMILGQESQREARDARRRLRRNLDASVQALEGRMLLSHAGVVHVRHSSQAIISKLDQKHGRATDDGPGHNALDHKGKHGHRKDNASQVSSSGRQGWTRAGQGRRDWPRCPGREGAKRKWQG